MVTLVGLCSMWILTGTQFRLVIQVLFSVLSVYSCALIVFQVSYYVQNLWQDTVDLNEGYLYNGAASAVYTILGKIYINNVSIIFWCLSTYKYIFSMTNFFSHICIMVSESRKVQCWGKPKFMAAVSLLTTLWDSDNFVSTFSYSCLPICSVRNLQNGVSSHDDICQVCICCTTLTNDSIIFSNLSATLQFWGCEMSYSWLTWSHLWFQYIPGPHNADYSNGHCDWQRRAWASYTSTGVWCFC